ncbi:MAG: protease modulator HflC [Verrucomicrobiota bacterium]|jgi:membrane protease subunit HflC
MKRSLITYVTASLLVVVFLMMMFAFQVRQTEIAIVTVFGNYSGAPRAPGIHFRLPWPVESVHRFDNRIRNFEKKYEPTSTRDGRLLMTEVFVGWRIAEPKLFLERFSGDVNLAQQRLDELVRQAKNSVVGQHELRDFISTNPKELKFDAIEREILDVIKPKAATTYGIEVSLVGFKQIGLPESVTAKVFERMRAEREGLVKQFKGEGERDARTIRSNAERERQSLLTAAEKQATGIKGQADAKAAEALKTFEQNPELAVFLLKLQALEESLRDRSTLILDPQTPPFDLLRGQTGLPGAK